MSEAAGKKFDPVFAAAEASLAERRAALARRREELRLFPPTEIIDAERDVAHAEAALDREEKSLQAARAKAAAGGMASPAG